MKIPKLDQQQTEVLSHIFKECETIEEMPKEERLKASNRLKANIDSLIPPIQQLRLMSANFNKL